MKKTMLLASAAIGATLAGPVCAEPTKTASEQTNRGEIIVTAQRREQSLMDVPIAITAVTSESLEKSGIKNATEIPAVVPNISMVGAYGNAAPNYIIRGIGSDQNLAGLVSPVGVYVDDSYLVSRMSNGVQLFDVERVEVLRGPQGTLFGRNTTGGAVNIITKKPSLGGMKGVAEVGYGNFNTYQAQGAVEAALVPDVLGFRIAGNYEKTDGGFDNLVPNTRDPLSGKNYAGRFTVRYEPNDQLDVSLKAYGGRDRHAPISSIHVGTGPGGANGATGYVRPPNLSFYELESDVQDAYNNTEAWGGMGTVSYKLNDAVTISSLTSYDGSSWHMYSDIDGTPIDELDQMEHDSSRQFNQELKASITSDKLDLIVGGYYGKDRTKVFRGLDLFFFLQDLGLPADPTFAAGGAGLRESYTQNRNSKALFAQADYRFTDKLTATAGFRYTWDRIRVTDALARITDYNGNPLFYTVDNPAGPDGAPLDPLRSTDSAPTGRLALAYEFTDDVNGYISFNHGYRSSAFGGSFFLSAAQAIFVDPEKVNTYEIGSKGRLFDGMLSYSAAAFLNKYKDQQIGEISDGVIKMRNAGSSTTYGAELELTGYVTDSLTLHGALGLLHSKYDTLTLSGVNLDGNEMPFAPKLTAQASFDWKVARIGEGDITLFGGASYRSRTWFSPNNDDPSNLADTIGNARLQQDGYVLVDGSVAWEKGPIMFKVWAKNLFEKKYLQTGYDLRAYGYDALYPGGPRTFGASLRYTFE